MIHSIQRATMIVCALSAMLFMSNIVQAQESGSVDYEAIKSNCFKECAVSEEDRQFCNAHCDCTVSELRKKGGEKAVLAAIASETELKSVAMTCSGRTIRNTLVSDCMAECGEAAECKKSCSCLSDQFKSFGSEIELGELVTEAGEGNPAATARWEQLLKACPL